MPEVIFNGPAGRIEGRYQPAKKRGAPLAIILPVAAAAISAIGLGLAFMRSWF